MCCYKLVTCEFKWFGLQGTVESRIQKVGVLHYLNKTNVAHVLLYLVEPLIILPWSLLLVAVIIGRCMYFTGEKASFAGIKYM